MRPPAWCKSKCATHNLTHKCDGGSYGTYSKRAYALEVSIRINGRATCAICDAYPVSLTEGEVDRTEAGCYRPGYIAMTCHRCNNERTELKGFNSARYAAKVLAVSEGIRILGPTEAKAMWLNNRPQIGETIFRSQFFDGE